MTVFHWIVLGVVAVPAGLLILFFQLRNVEYHITSRHLCVRWLGFTLRRLELTNIESISKRQRYLAEHWWNTPRSKHRRLVIRRRSGLFRNFVITPRYRYEFRNDLEAAIQRIKSGSG